MRLQTNTNTNTTKTAIGTNNSAGNNNTTGTSGTTSATAGMDSTTMTATATEMTVSVGSDNTRTSYPGMTGLNGDGDGIPHTDTSPQDFEPELDDPIEDQEDALREHDQARQYDDDVMAVARLGEWLREQQTMEDALVLLQQEGWMF